MSEDGTSHDGHETAASVVPPTVVTPDVNKGLVQYLENTDKNMSQMASLLGQIADKLLPRSESPPGEKRSKRTADKSDFSDSASDSENTTSRPRKRSRESNPPDDDLSVHASDEFDEEDDLKKLTERPQANGQKERENLTAETKLLQDIANGFDDDDATGDKINQELADVAVKRWDKKLSSDKIKSLVEKYKRPENCGDIKGTKVNPEIWSQLNSRKRKTDLQLSNLQQVIRKVTFATLQTTNMLVENPSSATDNSKAITQSVDSIAMLGHLNTQLSQFRREQIKPALKSEYSAICSAEVPLSSQYLFGDDLAKKLRDARESSKISNSVSHSSPRPTYKAGSTFFGPP